MLQKWKKFLKTILKRTICSNKCTAHNIVFAKGGVEYIIEKPDTFSRNLLFILYFFVI